MTALNKRLSRKIRVSRGKGNSNSHPEHKGRDEEDARKAKEETSRRLAKGANKLLVEEAKREKQEQEHRQKEEYCGGRKISS